MTVTVTNNTEKTVKKIKVLGRTFCSRLEGGVFQNFSVWSYFPEGGGPSSGQIRPSWVLGPPCVSLLSWMTGPMREEVSPVSVISYNPMPSVGQSLVWGQHPDR